MNYELADSGERRTFTTGAVRDQLDGKGRYDLISPIALKRLAIVYEKGARKYAERNWERGIPVSCCIDSALRHLFNYLAGMEDEDHLAQAMWNVAAAIHIEHQANAGVLPAALLDSLPRYDEGSTVNGEPVEFGRLSVVPNKVRDY